jgi:cytidine deaminase
MTDAGSLLQRAREAAKSAYAPYSKFRVGAAVLAGGSVFTGCNVENASYGLTICAERNAMFQAVAAGYRRIDALALVCVDVAIDGPAKLRMPCGACRQVMAEFGTDDLPIEIDGVGVFRLADLLPSAFSL